MKKSRLLLAFFATFLLTSAATLNDTIEHRHLRRAKVELFAAPYFASDPEFSSQTHFNNINYGDVYDEFDGEGITVAIIDTGINYNHEDFWDATGNVTNISDKSASFLNSNYGVTTKKVSQYGYSVILDNDGHGTAVAGTVAAQYNGKGTVGVSPKATLMVLRTDLYFDEINAAIRYAADNGADVINMSLGVYKTTFTDKWGDVHTGVSYANTYFQAAINYAFNKGVTLVAAAGNEYTDQPSYPASNTNVIGVGALEKNSGTTRAWYSNSGTTNVTLVAPGSVYVPDYDPDFPADNEYDDIIGTSFASPIVASAVALYKQKYPYATPTTITNALIDSAYDIGTQGHDSIFGYGRLDIDALLGDDIILRSVSVSPQAATLVVGETLQLTTTFYPENATNTFGYYISNGAHIASVDEDTGLVTAVAPGVTTIGFLSEDGPDDEMTVTVLPHSGPIAVTNISSAQQTITVGINKTHTLALSLTPSYATNANLNFTSANASVATINSCGVITGVSSGSTTVTISSKEPGANLVLDVFVPNTVEAQTTYKFTSASWAATSGGSSANWTSIKAGNGYDGGTRVQVTTGTTGAGAISPVSYQNIKNIEIGYSTNASKGVGNIKMYWNTLGNSNKTNLIGTFTVSTSGGTTRRPAVMTPSTPIEEGYLVLEVNVSTNSIYIHDITIDYETIPPTPIKVTGVSFDNENLDLKVGNTALLNHTITPSNATNTNVSYSSNNPSVATVSSSGHVTAHNVGSATITITTQDGNFSDTVSVSVTELVLTEPTLILNANSFPLAYSFGAPLDLSKLSAQYTDEYGVITTVNGTQLALVSGNTKTLGSVSLVFSYLGVSANVTINVTNVGSDENVLQGTAKSFTLTSESFSPGLSDIAKSGTFESNGFQFEGKDLRKLNQPKDNLYIKENGYFYNKTAIATISSIRLDYLVGGGASATHSVRFSTSAITSGHSGDYDYNTSAGGSSRTINAPEGATHFRLDVGKNLQANITVNYTTGGSLTFTHSEQADAFTDYFLDVTHGECLVSDVKQTTWDSLEAEYNALTPEAKVLVQSSSDADFHARYNIIINGYPFYDFVFATNSNAQPHIVTNNALIYVLLMSALILGFYGLLTYRKHRKVLQ